MIISKNISKLFQTIIKLNKENFKIILKHVHCRNSYLSSWSAQNVLCFYFVLFVAGLQIECYILIFIIAKIAFIYSYLKYSACDIKAFRIYIFGTRFK